MKFTFWAQSIYEKLLFWKTIFS